MRAFAGFMLLAAAALSTPARAVPIPWLNCGTPGDALKITQANASAWPPPVAAPGAATATLDAAGRLLDLRLTLLQGVPWTFDSGPLPTTTNAGFVSLPPSFPVSVAGPPLPLAAGPYVTTRTFTGNGSSVTIADKATLAVPVSAPLTATVGLSTNGSSGFPLVSAAGDAYELRVQVNEAGGAGVFCMDVTVPLKTANPFVTIVQASDAPTLSTAGAILLAALLLASGWLAHRRRARSP
jgi:hypothetical protein